MTPSLEVTRLELTDVILLSIPVTDPTEREVPILTRMRDDLANTHGDGLSELPTEIEE